MASSSEHLSSLDALRGAAALAVVIPHFFLHFGPATPGAEITSILAVEVFFVLSGFVLAPQILHCMAGDGRDLLTFYGRRWMRTIPPYIIVLCAIAIVTRHFADRDFLLYLAMFRNLIAIDPAGEFFVPAWSLAVEEWFYLIFPLCMMAATRMRWSALAAGVGFVTLLFAVKATVALAYPDLMQDGRRIVVLRLDAIAFGFLLFLVIDRVRPWMAMTACLAGLAGSIVSYTSHNVVLFAYCATLFGCGLLATVRLLEPLFTASMSIRSIAAAMAAISYTIYLMHTLVLLLMHRHGSGPLQFVIYLTALLSLSALFYWTIERPTLALRPRYRPGRAAEAAERS